MNRDIVLGSSIVLGAIVLAATVSVHDANQLKSLQLQSEIACTVDGMISRQAAQQASAQQTLKEQFIQEQQFISRHFAQQKIRFEESLAAVRQNDAQSEQASAGEEADVVANAANSPELIDE